MPEIGRAQLFVYAAIAVALLFFGSRAIRGEDGAEGGFEASSGQFGDGEYAGVEGGEGGDDGESSGGFSLSGDGADLVVDVAGAVARPGVYRMPAGSRVDDALARAGGPAPGAALEAINRAARLADGQQVVVPTRSPGGRAVTAVGPGGDEGPISLGTATVEQLDTIEGIGPVTAADIVEFRDEHGGLSSIDQLDQISGIGPATMEALRSRLQP